MKRIIVMVLKNIIFVPYYWIMLNWYAAHVDKYTEEQRYAMLKKIDHAANRGGNLHIEASPVPFSVVAKKEVGNVPFLKQVFSCMKAFLIDREDIKQSMQVIINVTKEVKAGRNYLIFAEGTRSKNGNHPQEFKGGSFKAAMKAKCPIVPVALIDSYKAFDTGSAKMLNVQVHFLKPMEYEEYKDMKSTEIAAEVKRRIEETIRANENSNCSLRNQ